MQRILTAQLELLEAGGDASACVAVVGGVGDERVQVGRGQKDGNETHLKAHSLVAALLAEAQRVAI